MKKYLYAAFLFAAASAYAAIVPVVPVSASTAAGFSDTYSSSQQSSDRGAPVSAVAGSGGENQYGDDYSAVALANAHPGKLSIFEAAYLDGGDPNDTYASFGYATASVILHLNQPVYLAEKVAALGGAQTGDEGQWTGFGGFGFGQGLTNDSCSILLQGGYQSCSTGLSFFGGGDVTATYSLALAGGISDGDGYVLSAFQLTPGLVDVFNTDKQLVETIDLANYTPEPAPFALIVAGLVTCFCIARFRAQRHGSRVS